MRIAASKDIRKHKAKDTVVNVRVPRHVRDLIDNAAEAVGKTRSDFMIESARNHATDVLLDRRLFTLDAAAFDAFVKALDEPVKPGGKLKKLLARTPAWEK